ncbi:MAG: response regulator [Alphaproteobacteria bacterium]|nr:response regulator [Alphaproteobacteria bacterium]
MHAEKHIVVTDHSNLFRRLLRLMLESAGLHRITETEHYHETLKILRTHKVDLLLLEYELNGFCGLDFIRQIRSGQSGVNKEVPIIVLTDPLGEEWLDQKIAGQVIAAGANACLTKPISIKKFLPPILEALAQEPHVVHEPKHVVAPFGFAAAFRQSLERLNNVFMPVPQIY